MFRTASILTIAAALASPARGQETVETLAARTALIEARAALEKAETDRVSGRLAVLGLQNDATGKTEITGGGGEFEGWLLSARAIETAATLLNGSLTKLNSGGRPVVLLAADEAFDMGLPATMRARLAFLLHQADATLAGAACGGGGRAPEGAPGMIAPAAIAGIGALVSAFRTDTTVTGFAGPDAARMVIAAMAATRTSSGAETGDYVVPADLIAVPEGSSLIEQWARIEERRDSIARCRTALARQGDATKPQVERLDAQVGNIDDFAAKQVGAGSGVSPLLRAAQLDAVVTLKPMILRVYVEKAGGSILNRRNLWTALGAPAVGVTGGAVIGWRLSEPTTGSLLGGGNLVCRTELTSMRAIQSGRVRSSSCNWAERPS